MGAVLSLVKAERFKVYTIKRGRKRDFLEFIEAHQDRGDRAAIVSMVNYLVENGIGIGGCWKVLKRVGKPAIHYMRSPNVRIPFVLHPTVEGVFVILSAFKKQAQDWPPGETEKAIADRDSVPGLRFEEEDESG